MNDIGKNRVFFINNNIIIKTLKYPVLMAVIFFIFIGCATDTRKEEHSVQNRIEQKRIFDESGGFSIIPPEKWRVIEMPGRYKTFVGQRENNYTPLVSLGIDIFDEQLNKVVDLLIEDLVKNYGEDFKLLQRDSFITLNNIEGERIIFNITFLGRHVLQYQYFLPGNEKKILQAICGVSPEDRNKYDVIFDGMMKTFEWNEYTAKSNVDDKERYFIEESGKFLLMPYGVWQIMKFPEIQYNALSWGNIGNFSLILFVSVDDDNLNKRIDSFLEEVKNMYGERIELIQRSDFVTYNNLKGEKLVFNIMVDGSQTRQITYFLPGKDNKIISAMCYASKTETDLYTEIFDKTMKTFEWIE